MLEAMVRQRGFRWVRCFQNKVRWCPDQTSVPLSLEADIVACLTLHPLRSCGLCSLNMLCDTLVAAGGEVSRSLQLPKMISRSGAAPWHRSDWDPSTRSPLHLQPAFASGILFVSIKSHSGTNRCGFWRCCAPEDTHSFDKASEHLSEYLVSRARWIDANVDTLLQ